MDPQKLFPKATFPIIILLFCIFPFAKLIFISHEIVKQTLNGHKHKVKQINLILNYILYDENSLVSSYYAWSYDT